VTVRSAPCRSAWSIPEGVCYLNHGSFGPTPVAVQAAREAWSRRVASQPMQFFVRELDAALDAAADSLARFVGASASDLVFVENATAAMNVVAGSLPLQPGDEVLLNDHEYGAVRRIWQRACARQGARLVTVPLTPPLSTVDDVVEPLRNALTERTRLVVVSHVTSPTAVVFPVEPICAAARERGVPVCIDGPHAIAMRPLDLRRVGCTFYCASLHKWLSAPFGSGFLYVDRAWQQRMVPTLWSWGRSLGGRPSRWQDEWNWPGTRDPAAFLAVPAAIECLQSLGIEQFRQHGHALARQARQQLEALFQTQALCADSPEWYGTMITVPLPEGPLLREQPHAADPLQQALWQQFQIETLMTDWNGRRHLRVSFHLYHSEDDVDRLMTALQALRELWIPQA
jgi:isopenicillin-N epimerase